MSKYTLEINGEEIPLPADAEVAITYQAMDMRNAAERTGAYLEELTLPETNKVKKALGNSELVTSATMVPYRELPVNLKHQGNPIFPGTASHNEVDEGYKLNITGQNATLFGLVKGRKLSEIDLSDLDHSFTNNGVGAARTHDLGRGYLYPLINNGRFTDRELKPGNVRFDELRPAVYVRTLLERMAAPYTLTGSILQDAKFNKLVVPFTNRHFQYRESYASQFKAKAELTYNVPFAGSSLFIWLPTDNVVNDSQTMLESTGTDTFGLRVPFAGNFEVKVVLRADVNVSGSTGSDIYVYRERGSGLEEWGRFPVSAGQQQRIEASVTVENCQPNDLIYIGFEPATLSTGTILPGTSIEFTLQNVVFPGNPVHLEANLPDVSQEGLLLAVCNMFNLLIQTDTVRKTFRLDSLERMRWQNPVDWSKKIDWTTKPRFTFALSEYGQQSYLAYGENEATDLLGNPITDSMVFEVDNEQLEPEKELFTSAFTFTQMRPAFRGALTLPYIPLFNQAVLKFEHWNPDTAYVPEDWVYWDGDYWVAKRSNTNVAPSSFTFDDWEETTGPRVFEELEANPRLLLVETRSETVQVGEDYNPGSFYPFNAYGTFEGLESETLQSEYHGITEKMLQQTRIMRLNVRLRLPDINALDFLRPVMLNVPAKNLQGCFYLNKINQYRPDRFESTEVELVRLYGMPLAALAEAGHLEFSEEFSNEFN